MTSTTIIAVACGAALVVWAGFYLVRAARQRPGPTDPVLLAPARAPHRPPAPRPSVPAPASKASSQAGLASMVPAAAAAPVPPATTAQVRTVPVETEDGTRYDVACSACGILATRTVPVAADEDARWHRVRGWHHGMHDPSARETSAHVIPLRPVPQENP